MKSLVYCQIQLFQFEDALRTLREIEAIQEMNFDDDDKQLKKTRKLIASAQYDLFKHPSFLEMIARNVTLMGFRDIFNKDHLCKCAADIHSGDDYLPCQPKPPSVKTKMSGHTISYA